MSSVRQSLVALGLALLVLLVVVLIRTFTLQPRTIKAPECKPLDTDFIQADKNLVGRFRKALQYQTVSWAKHDYNSSELTKLREFIKTSKSSVEVSRKICLQIEPRGLPLIYRRGGYVQVYRYKDPNQIIYKRKLSTNSRDLFQFSYHPQHLFWPSSSCFSPRVYFRPHATFISLLTEHFFRMLATACFRFLTNVYLHRLNIV